MLGRSSQPEYAKHHDSEAPINLYSPHLWSHSHFPHRNDETLLSIDDLRMNL